MTSKLDLKFLAVIFKLREERQNGYGKKVQKELSQLPLILGLHEHGHIKFPVTATDVHYTLL